MAGRATDASVRRVTRAVRVADASVRRVTRAVRVTDASVRRVTRAVRVTHALVRRLSSSDRVTDAPVRRLGRGGGGELYEHGADAAALAELVSPVVAPVALAPPLELAPPPTGASASMGIGLGRASIGCTF
jgi:hypothetical protein